MQSKVLEQWSKDNYWIEQLEGKSKRTIFLRPFGFMRGFEGVKKLEPASTVGRPERRSRADQRSVSAPSGMEVEVF